MAIIYQPWMRYLGMGWLWNPEKGVQLAGPGLGSNEAGVTVTDTTAMQVGAVFRCIRILAETGGNLPLLAYKRDANGDRTQLERDHYLQRLIDEPNPEMTGDEWREAMVGQMAGWGNGYSQKVPNAAGRPVELWPYKPDRMKVERGADWRLKYTYPNANGYPEELPRDRVLHMRSFSIDGVMGLSPLSFAAQTLGLAIGAQNYASRFFAKGGRPPGVMTSDRPLNDKQRDQIRREYEAMATGEGSKSFWLLEASLKYQAVAVNPEDMQMLQTRSFEISEIARFFGVPLFLLMETEKSTSWGSGLEQANLAFLTYTLRPYLSRIENSINRWVIPQADRSKIFTAVDEEQLLRADLAALSAYYQALAVNGVMDRQEIRRKLKLPARRGEPNADKLTVQGAMLPLEKLGMKPEAQNITAADVRQIFDDAMDIRMAALHLDTLRSSDRVVVTVREAYAQIAADLGRLSSDTRMTADTLPHLLKQLAQREGEAPVIATA